MRSSGGSFKSDGSFKIPTGGTSSGGSILSNSRRSRRNSDTDSFRERQTSGAGRERERRSRRERRMSDEMSDASYRERESRTQMAAAEAEAAAAAVDEEGVAYDENGRPRRWSITSQDNSDDGKGTKSPSWSPGTHRNLRRGSQ